MPGSAAGAERLTAHDHLRERLPAVTDDALRDLVMAAPARTAWAATHIVELDGHPLFVKRLPLTDRVMSRSDEAAPFSTPNPGERERERADALIGGPVERSVALLDHVEALVDTAVIDLPQAYIAALAGHREVIEHMHAFLADISRPDKQARFDDATFRRLLGM